MMATVITEDLECCGGSVGGGEFCAASLRRWVGLGYLLRFDQRESGEERRGKG